MKSASSRRTYLYVVLYGINHATLGNFHFYIYFYIVSSHFTTSTIRNMALTCKEYRLPLIKLIAQLIENTKETINVKIEQLERTAVKKPEQVKTQGLLAQKLGMLCRRKRLGFYL